MDTEYNHEAMHGEQQPSNTKAKLSDLNKSDLIDLISHLELEVHNRDSVISEMMNQQTKQVLYQAKYGRFGATDPFTALQRDSEKVENDSFNHNQVKSLFDNQLQQLENLIETQRRAQATMKEQKLLVDEKYKKVCEELDEAKRKHAHDTAQGDDVTVALEKEREKLHQDLAYTRGQLKKSDKELKKTKSQLNQQIQIATKHKQVALDLIKERRKMVSKVAEAEKKNQTIAQLLQKEQEDSQKSENSKLLQLEARMEKQLMDFDIEREQYKVRIRKEEGKVRDLLHQLTDIKETVLSLQHDSTDLQLFGSSCGHDSTDSSNIPEGTINIPISLVNSTSSTAVLSQNPSAMIEVTSRISLSASDQKLNETVEQQTVRLDPGPSLSPPPRQSLDGTRSMTTVSSEQHKLTNSSELNKAKQSTVTPGANQKSVTSQSASTSRLSYYRQTIVAPGGSNRMSGISSPRSQYNTGESKPTSQANKAIKTIDTAPPVQLVNTSIPTRLTTRNNSAIINTGPQVSPKPAVSVHANKQPLKVVTTTSNVIGNRSSIISPRSTTVPPHLSSVSPSMIDSKLVNVANWRNSVPGGSIVNNDSANTRTGRLSGSLLSPTEKSTVPGSVTTKPKPPPPVRNVSLPSTKKYQSIENAS